MNKSESKYFHTAKRMDEALLSLLLEKDFEYITVKDVCARAAVNRSTFYLHYENTSDLLMEAIAMIHERFQTSIPVQPLESAAISELHRDDLFFITDHWLFPYLGFVKENKHVYKAIHTQMDVFGAERAYEQFFQSTFSPILSRFGVAREKHDFIMAFYRHGLTAVLMKWVESDCRESVDDIAGIIKLCVGEDCHKDAE